ncbi:MAG: ATP-binding protein, partial [Planctomycetota bacterium]
EFEDLLLSLSMRFINLPLDRFDEELTDALREVTEFTGVCRSFIYLFDEQKLEARLANEWAVPGRGEMPPEFHRLALADYPWTAESLRSGEPIHIPTPAALPAEAADFRRQLEGLGVKSYINVPMLDGDEVVGHLGCSCVRAAKTWSDDEIALLRVLGEVFINALRRREAERALAESERRLLLTVDSLQEGVFDWNIETGHAYISNHVKRAVGLAADTAGWHFDEWFDRLHVEDRTHVMARLDAHLQGAAELYDAEFRFRTEREGFRWMHARGRVVERAPDGRPLRMVGVQRDITATVAAREEQRRQQDQMMHLGRVAAMGETVAGIAHEVNQPLHAAATFCAAAREAVRSDRPDSAQKAVQLCEQAAAQVGRAGDIIHRLREFTRPRATHVGPVGINDLVTQTVDFVGQLGKLRGVDVKLDLDAAAPMVRADRVQLQQVLVNLIQNACDALRESPAASPAVEVRTHLVGSVVEGFVIDNATGAPPDDPEAIFDAFYTTKADGMGIGLTLCRTILSAQGGVIAAEANAERGMTFRFTLPAEEDPPR